MCVLQPLQLCLVLCNPIDCDLPGSSVHGIFPARIMEWVSIPPPEDLSNPGAKPPSPMSTSCIAGRFFTTESPGNPGKGNISKDV